MPHPVRIVDEAEAIRWIEDRTKTYKWMANEHLRKYGVKVSPSTFVNLRKRKGIKRRITRDDQLIPWAVREEHRQMHILNLLRFEARRRRGESLLEHDEKRLDSFLRKLEDLSAVVYYEPLSEEGFHLIPREEGDTDIVRQPPERLRTNRKSDD